MRGRRLHASAADALDEIGDAQRAHAAEGETTDHGVDVAAALLQRVDRHQRQLRVRLGIVAQVQVSLK